MGILGFCSPPNTEMSMIWLPEISLSQSKTCNQVNWRLVALSYISYKDAQNSA